MHRRKFLKNLSKIAGLGVIGGFYSFEIEPFWVEFVRMTMPIKGIPKEWIGKTILQISDIHIGSDFDYRFIIRSFQEASHYKPDVVVYTGDYVSLTNGNVEYDKLKDVLSYSVRGKVATFGVLGNHDYGIRWSQPDVAQRITNILTDNGIPILRNEKVSCNGLNIIGLDDYFGTNFFPKEVLSTACPLEANIALCHNPDVCDLDIWCNFEGWVLSGHTHGGQVKPPFMQPLVLPVRNKKYTSGKFQLDAKRNLYINRALGHLKQVRFNVRPEITIFEIVEG